MFRHSTFQGALTWVLTHWAAGQARLGVSLRGIIMIRENPFCTAAAAAESAEGRISNSQARNEYVQAYVCAIANWQLPIAACQLLDMHLIQRQPVDLITSWIAGFRPR